ncbi:MAG: hypothetical protein JXL80_18035 [Planctomycetes bacterium]|nr:hypothetical protein [Planctomycetota bacterium]
MVSRSPKGWVLALILVCTLGILTSAQAAVVNWVAGTGDFYQASNWSPAVVPGSADTARIDNDGTVVFSPLSATERTIKELNVGYGNNLRDGTFQHLSGTLTVSGNLLLAADIGRQARYTLDGGGLQAGYFMAYGKSNPSDAVFRHWRGTAQLPNVTVGNDWHMLGPYGGAYELGDPAGAAAPLLTAGNAYVNPLSLFDQTGGQANIDYYTLRGTHRYTGGTLQLNHGWVHGGLMDFQGASVGVQAGNALVDLSLGGTFANGTNASFTSGPLSMVILPPGFNAGVFGGGFTPGNLTHTAGTTMEIAAGEAWEGWGVVEDHVNCSGSIDAGDGGWIDLMNGLNVDDDGYVCLGTGSLLVEDLTSGMTGGTLIGDYTLVGVVVVACDLFIGRETPGAFTITGDSLCTVGSIWISDEGSGDGSAEGTLSVGGTATLESVGGIWIGFDGDGTYNQSGGTVTTDTFTAAFGDGTQGDVILSGGSLTTGAVRLGNGDDSVCTVTHSGGHWETPSFLKLAAGDPSVVTYTLSGTGVLDTQSVTVGSDGIGTFTQTGGTHNIETTLIIAGDSDAEGRYNMSGGALNVGWYIGLYNVNTTEFNHSGGTVTTDEIRLGSQSENATNGFGTYSLSGTGTVVANQVNVGKWSDGEFLQSGGTSTISGPLNVGVTLNPNTSRGEGDYELSGTGQLSTVNTVVGLGGTGDFLQTGGTHTVAGALVLGDEASGIGTYDISGGSLSAADLVVGQDGTGTLTISDAAAQITVSNLLYIGPGGSILAVPGGVIQMTGSAFENESTDPALLADMEDLELVFEGGDQVVDTYEVAGKALAAAGENPNFILGALTIGGTKVGRVRLVDEFDNQPGWTGTEVLYVRRLTVGAGSTLDLGGLTLYCDEMDIDPEATIEGGAPIIPGSPSATAATGSSWVYQNTGVTLSRGGHRTFLVVDVLDFGENQSVTVTVAKLAGSGAGEVTIEDDPDGDPMIKFIVGSLRTDGTTGTDNLTLRVAVTGDTVGEAVVDVPMRVRPLGDIDGNGGVEPTDLSLLINRLNNLPIPPGYKAEYFDLDCNGGAEPTDISLLINVLNGLPVS